MADVTLTYKGNTIAEMNASGSKTIETAGKYCEADIGLEYVKPSGGAAPENDVQFLDYDGTIVYSYTAAEFAQLIEMPPNPDHTDENLTSQGWNWTLADAKAQVALSGFLDIGQMYITTDGKTYVDIHLDEYYKSPILGICPNGSVDIDWGDGTPHDTLTGTSVGTPVFTSPHAYSRAGDYTIALTITGSAQIRNSGIGITHFSILIRATSAVSNENYQYMWAVRRVRLGSNITGIANGSFDNCFGLEVMTIPYGISLIEQYAWANCASLKALIVPSSVTSFYGTNVLSGNSRLRFLSFPKLNGRADFGSLTQSFQLKRVALPGRVTQLNREQFSFTTNWAPPSLEKVYIGDGVTALQSFIFLGCLSLKEFTFPSTITDGGYGVFGNCYSLRKITISAGTTRLEYNYFNNCFSLKEVHFKPTTPPTMNSSSAWNNVPTTCVIYVPTGSLSAYTGATNYPSSSTYTYVEE